MHKKQLLQILTHVLVAVVTATVTVALILFTGVENPQKSKLQQLEDLILDRFVDGAEAQDLEDAAANELTILGAPCRKLGEVKNGGELTVEIDEEMHTIYAIVDVITKDTCVDKAEIPEGTEDIVVSGKNRLAPLKGNPFIFEN